MTISASKPKRADPCSAGSVCAIPLSELGIDKKWAAVEIYFRIRFFKMEARRDFAVLEYQSRFDEAGNTSSRVQVPDICFD